jgi:hypothetical protein
MPSLNPQSPLGLIAETARTQAVAGAAAGATLGILHTIVTLHRKQLNDGYEMLAEGMAEVGTGTFLGLLAGLAAGATGATAVVVAGRGIWTIAAPFVVGALTSSIAYRQVDRVIRPLSADIARGLKVSLESRSER